MVPGLPVAAAGWRRPAARSQEPSFCQDAAPGWSAHRKPKKLPTSTALRRRYPALGDVCLPNAADRDAPCVKGFSVRLPVDRTWAGERPQLVQKPEDKVGQCAGAIRDPEVPIECIKGALS